MSTINIASDFSRTPGGRYISDGPFSGELFRERLLVPALRGALSSKGKVVVVLDGTRGYLSSFLEESFGGLVREHGFTKHQLDRILELRAIDSYYETYRNIALRSIADARAERSLAH